MYHELRNGVDNEFFLAEIKETGGSVPEVGVGTGRLFLKCLELGIDILGIDVSKSMNRILSGQPKEKDHTRISLQNLNDFNFNFPFSLVLAPLQGDHASDG